MSKISQNRVITFDNQSIKNLNPDISEFGKRNSLFYSFKISEDNENLKGLKLKIMKETGSKYFIVDGFFNSKRFEINLGLFRENFRSKHARKLMDQLADKIRDKKLKWIADPKAFVSEYVDEEKDVVHLEMPTLRTAIETIIYENFPRLKFEGSLAKRHAQDVFRYLAGYNIRGRFIKFTEKDGDVVMTLRDKPIINKLRGPDKKKPLGSLKELFEKFPSGTGVLSKAKHYNISGVTSLYDDPISQKKVDTLSRQWMKSYINKYDAYGTKQNCLKALKYLWNFCREKEWFIGVTDPEVISSPGSQVVIKRPKTLLNKASIYNKHYFLIPELERIEEACFQLRDKFPFCCEVILLMMYTGRRFQETIKLKKAYIKQGENIILVPKTISKIREDQFITITPPVQSVLDSLDYQMNKNGFKIFKKIDWMFPTIRALYSDNLDPEYLNGYDTRIKNINKAWEEVKILADIEKGSLKSFRKSYSTHATKVFDGDTNKASKLTGHTRKETLERFYYQENQEEVIQSANKVAKIFTFN